MLKKPSYQGAAFLLTAAFLYGLYGIYSRLIGESFGSFYTFSVRAAIMLIFLVPFFILTKQWKKIVRRDYKWFAIMVLPGVAAIVFVFIAFNRLPIGTVYFVLHSSCTLSSYLIGKLFFAEKMSPVKWLSLILYLSGLFLIFKGMIAYGQIWAMLLALLAGLGSAAWNIFSKKVTTAYSLWQVLIIDCFIMVAVTLPIAFFRHEPIALPSFSAPWLVVIIFALTCIITSSLTLAGFKLVEAQKGSLVMLLEPVFGTLLAYLLFKELVGPFFVFGAGLISVGMLLPILKEEKSDYNP